MMIFAYPRSGARKPLRSTTRVQKEGTALDRPKDIIATDILGLVQGYKIGLVDQIG